MQMRMASFEHGRYIFKNMGRLRLLDGSYCMSREPYKYSFYNTLLAALCSATSELQRLLGEQDLLLFILRFSLVLRPTVLLIDLLIELF